MAKRPSERNGVPAVRIVGRSLADRLHCDIMYRLRSRLQQGQQRVVRAVNRVNTPFNQRRALGLVRIVGTVALGLLAVAMGWLVFAVVVEVIWGQMGLP